LSSGSPNNAAASSPGGQANERHQQLGIALQVGLGFLRLLGWIRWLGFVGPGGRTEPAAGLELYRRILWRSYVQELENLK